MFVSFRIIISIVFVYFVLQVPLCKVIRFNIEYTIHYFEEDMIEVWSHSSVLVIANLHQFKLNCKELIAISQ